MRTCGCAGVEVDGGRWLGVGVFGCGCGWISIMVYVVPVWVWLDKHYGLCRACLGVGVVGYVLSSMLCLFGCGCG